MHLPRGLTPHLILPRHIRLGVLLEEGHDSWEWFEALWIVCFQTTLQGMHERHV